MITNEKIDAYNEAAVSILTAAPETLNQNVKVFSVSKLIAQETIKESWMAYIFLNWLRETVRILVSVSRDCTS